MLNKRILTLIFAVAFLTLLVGCFPQPTNQVPVITSIPITAVDLGMDYLYDVNATDPDEDVLTYYLVTKPPGMTINSATGLVKWTPTKKGYYAVVVKVSDGDLDITQSFTIVVSEESPGYTPPCPTPTPVNHFPKITSIPGDTAIVGVEYIYKVKATDPDGDVLTYSLITKPEGMVIVPATGVISWIPTEGQVGVGNFTVKVSDGKLSDTQTFGIIVKAEGVVEPLLDYILADPAGITLTVGDTQQLTITAWYEDGTSADVTSDCAYWAKHPEIVTVDGEGLVTAIGVGKNNSCITAKYYQENDFTNQRMDSITIGAEVTE